MGKNIVVSIVVPVYNVEIYLKKCLDSLCNQTYKNIEIIVVNDGSPDRSEKIIKKFQENDKRINYVIRENGGLGAARNTGIDACNGEYICFVDSDDWVSPNYVESFVNAVEKDGSDVVISNIKYVYEDGRERARTPWIPMHKVVKSREALALEFIGKQYKFHAPNKFCKKKIISDNAIRFPEGKLYEDVFTTYKLLMCSSKISLIPDATYYYLQSRSGSIMNTSLKQRRFLDMFNALDEIMTNQTIESLKLEDEIQCLYVENVISLVNYVYPLVGRVEKRKIREYETWIKEDKHHQVFTSKVWKNGKLSIISKIRAFMIEHFFFLYCIIMRCAKRVAERGERNGALEKRKTKIYK